MPQTWLLKLYFLYSSEKVIPDFVLRRESKTSFLLLPIHDTMPEPVITTLRINSP
jgi:hypothetical protein